jgi:hypothetical protein
MALEWESEAPDNRRSVLASLLVVELKIKNLSQISVVVNFAKNHPNTHFCLFPVFRDSLENSFLHFDIGYCCEP